MNDGIFANGSLSIAVLSLDASPAFNWRSSTDIGDFRDVKSEWIQALALSVEPLAKARFRRGATSDIRGLPTRRYSPTSSSRTAEDRAQGGKTLEMTKDQVQAFVSAHERPS